MLELNEQYLTDKNGKRTAVVIPIGKFRTLQEQLSRFESQGETADCGDVTGAIVEGLMDVKTRQTVALDELLDALRD